MTMDHSENLKEAVQEVSAIAEELRAVKRRAEEYGQATARLQEIGGAIDRLVSVIAGMQSQFQQLLVHAEKVLDGLERARQSADATAKSVPQIVERIEASDVSQHVSKFVDSLNSAGARIGAQAAAVEQLQSGMSREREVQRVMFESITARIDRLSSEVSQVKGLAEPIAATYSASDKAANASTAYGHKGLQAISALGKRVDALQTQLESHHELLVAIKRKKGIQF